MNHQTKWTHASTGDPVWVSDPDEAYLEAVIASINGDTVGVETKSGKHFMVDCSVAHDRYTKPTARSAKKGEEQARRLLPRGIQRYTHGVENMDDLHPLNEACILSNIEFRFRIDHIYTRTGPILIAMNPFKWLPLYGDEVVRQYHNRPYGALPPHCFQEAEDAYQQLQFTHKNQSVIICGESGAGKTETTKLMLQYLSIVAREKSATGGMREKTIGEKLVQSNPLMEAFGNAKTLRNNNSSRFGKFTLLNFGKSFFISGGKVSNFLLEKSRVVRQQKGERNYHIFYQLVAGASSEQRSRFNLPSATQAESFYYLAQSGCLRVDGVDDAEEFGITKGAMEAVSIMSAEQDEMFQLVAGVLHLGNIDFDGSSDGESSTVKAGTALQIAAKLLGLQPAQLEEALTTRVRQLPGGKNVRSPQTELQSKDSRDALAKAVYNKIFDNLVLKINTAFDQDHSPNPSFIGILDIFGFEDLASNGFEQLLINFTNEKLQLLFNETTFKMEEEEYMREQIQWDRTDFPDNQPCVDLIEKKPMGLLPVLDSECSRGAVANDASLVATYNKAFKSHAHYSVCGPATAWRKSNDSHSFTNDNDFVVIHFAGPVIYTCVDFVERNRDALFDHVNTLMGTSTNKTIVELFQTREDGATALRAASITVSNRFTQQLSNLIHTLESSNPRFVRCIKSNQLLHPQVIDKPNVLKQLICSGVMAALEVRRAGFPTRIKYSDFVKDFRVLSVGFPKVDHAATLSHSRTKSQLMAASIDLSKSQRDMTDRELTAKMMTHPAVVESLTAKQYRLGVSKLFLQADALVVLQSIKNRMITPQVTKLQRWWIKQSTNVLAHKLKRAIATLADLQLKAEVNGVHRQTLIRNSLEESAAAVRYARGLGLLEPEVFRPAVNTAWEKLNVLKELVKKAIDAKEREMAQRAELLQLLDSGRARLGHVRKGLEEISLDSSWLSTMVERASESIEQRSADLLRAANRDILSGGTSDRLASSLSSSELQRMKREAVATTGDDDDSGASHEEVLHHRKRKVEETLAQVDAIETDFTKLLAQQRTVDSARAAARNTLASSKSEFKKACDLAEEVGIAQAILVKQAVAGTKEQIRQADQALEENDVEAFEDEVQKAGQAVRELSQTVDAERKRKEEDDLRQEGRGLLSQASERLTELCREAEEAGVRQAEPFVAAVRAVEGEISAVSLLVSGEPKAYLTACRALNASLDNLRGVLRSEKNKKEKNGQQRESELARLQPSLDSLKDIQSTISQSFQLASEEALCATVSAATQEAETVKALLEKSDNIASLRGRVDAAILQAANAERAFGEVRQRHEVRSREMSVAKSDWDALEKRLASLVSSLGMDGELLVQLTEEVIHEARDALADVDRAIRKSCSGDALRQVVSFATDRVDKVEATIKSQRQRIATAERAREDELARLELAERRLNEFLSDFAPALKDKAVVKDTISATDAAIRAAGERLKRRISYAWLQNEEIKQERAAVNDAISKVERAETLLLDEKKKYEAYLREAKANQSNLEFAAQKLHELQNIVEDARLGRIPAVQAALEECEAAFDVATKAVAASENGDAESGKRAVANVLDKLKKTENIVISSKAQKEAEEKERGEIQERLEALVQRFNAIVAMIDAAGPAVKHLTDATLRDATAAVNAASKLLRRAENLKELSSAVRLAAQKVDAVEAEALNCKDRAEHALKQRTNVTKKIAALADVLAMSVDKAEAAGVHAEPAVEDALKQAHEAVTLVKRRADCELDVWMREGTAISRLLDDATVKVETAEEIVDEEAQLRDRADREKQDVQEALDLLAERHANVARDSKEYGVAHTDAVIKAMEAAEAELQTVRTAFSSPTTLPPSLSQLSRLVSAEEDAVTGEARKLEGRSAEIKRAAAELPSLFDRLARLDALLQSPVLASTAVPAPAEEAYHAAQKSVWAIERFVAEGLTSLHLPVPRTAVAVTAVRKAEDLLNKHVAFVHGLIEKRADAIQRLHILERKFAALQEEVAELCSRATLDGSSTGRSESAAKGALSGSEVISEAVAAVEGSMSLVKKRVEAELKEWVEAGSAPVYRAMEDALTKMEKAAEVLENEKLRMRKEEQERQAAMNALDQHSDRLAKLRVLTEAKKIQNEAPIMEAIHAAESALEVVGKLLETGNAAGSPQAMEVASRKIVEAEEVVSAELQRRDRWETQRMAAREELSKLKIRAQALTEFSGFLELMTSEAVADAIKAVDTSVERANVALQSHDSPLATVTKEVRNVLQRIEHAEREVRRERTRRDEIARVRNVQEEEARLKAAKEAEEERRRVEQEKLYLVQLENELAKLTYRLSVHRPAVDRINKSMGAAEDAIKAANAKVSEGGIVAAKTAIQSAMAAIASFESTAQSTVWAYGGTDVYGGLHGKQQQQHGGMTLNHTQVAHGAGFVPEATSTLAGGKTTLAGTLLGTSKLTGTSNVVTSPRDF